MADEDKLVKAGFEVVFKPFADLIEKLAGPAVEEIGLTLQDHVKVIRLKRQLRLLQRTKEMLAEAGIEPQKVPLKILGSIIESASMEEDDALQDKWAALLANAAGDDDAVHPSFVEVLKQISALEAQFLDALFSLRNDDGPRGKGKVYQEQVVLVMVPSLENELSTKERRLKVSVFMQKFEKAGLHVSLDHLGLIKVEKLKENVFWYEMTRFGTLFVEACRTPQKLSQSAATTSSNK